VQEVEPLAPGRALDLACGEGRNAIWLASSGWQVTAVDFSEVAIHRGRRRARELDLNIGWVVADVTGFTDPRPYDLVLVMYLQTPAQDRARWMARARDALRIGGTFIFLGHDASNLEHGHGGPSSAEVLCTPRDIVDELPGFRIEIAEVIERPVSPEPDHGPADDTATARDALVRAVRIA
jgi:SAM-dependent methyltransferase